MLIPKTINYNVLMVFANTQSVAINYGFNKAAFVFGWNQIQILDTLPLSVFPQDFLPKHSTIVLLNQTV